MNHLDGETQSTLADVGDVVGVRFERLNVLANAINDLADENRNHHMILNMEDGLAQQIQSAAAFIQTEVMEAEKELDRVRARGEA